MDNSNDKGAENFQILLSAVCPVFNEAEHIRNVIEFFISSNPKEKELILVDGGSTDGTLSVIKEYSEKYSNIRALSNERRFTPFALNIGVKAARGKYIVRLDAHTEYEKNYFEVLIDLLERGKGDIVGGPIRMKWKSEFQRIAAFVTSSDFGIGASLCHNSDYEGYSDSVYLGAMRKSLFDEIGFFDENLPKNQDDEFNYRANKMGKKVFLSSSVVSYYFPKNSFGELFKHYFLFGFYKPRVLAKNISEAKLRHFIPSLFLLYLFSLIFIQSVFWRLPILIYFILALYFSYQLDGGFASKMKAAAMYFGIHFSYGAGFIIGLLKLIIGK